MLVLSRRKDESLLIAGNIRVTILGARGRDVKLGIEAPSEIPILRAELSPPRNSTPQNPGERIGRSRKTHGFQSDLPPVGERGGKPLADDYPGGLPLIPSHESSAKSSP